MLGVQNRLWSTGTTLTAFLENADSGGDEPDVSARGLCQRNVSENRNWGSGGKPTTGAQHSPN